MVLKNYFKNQKKRTSTKRKRSKSRSKSRTRKTYKQLKLSKKAVKRHFKKAKQINVKQDQEKNTKSYVKQKVTRSQQKIINRRFKNGYSPYEDNFTFGFQEVGLEPNRCKWYWRSTSNLNYVLRAFEFQKNSGQAAGTNIELSGTNTDGSETQSIYFSEFKIKYEILNPTNYDMNLVIYDLV